MLSRNPSAPLRVYAVWLPMLIGDTRQEWDGNTMPDPRVLHFWDGDVEVGRWFAKYVDDFEGIAWDVYYLYGPDAVWEDTPTPLMGSGGTIYDKREALMIGISRLLEK